MSPQLFKVPIPLTRPFTQIKGHWCLYQSHFLPLFSLQSLKKLLQEVDLASNGHQGLVTNHQGLQVLNHRHPLPNLTIIKSVEMLRYV